MNDLTGAAPFPAPPACTTAYYEHASNPWSEVILLSAGNLLHAGTNIITINVWERLPRWFMG